MHRKSSASGLQKLRKKSARQRKQFDKLPNRRKMPGRRSSAWNNYSKRCTQRRKHLSNTRRSLRHSRHRPRRLPLLRRKNRQQQKKANHALAAARTALAKEQKTLVTLRQDLKEKVRKFDKTRKKLARAQTAIEKDRGDLTTMRQTLATRAQTLKDRGAALAQEEEKFQKNT